MNPWLEVGAGQAVADCIVEETIAQYDNPNRDSFMAVGCGKGRRARESAGVWCEPNAD
jgi:hypothetical protein